MNDITFQKIKLITIIIATLKSPDKHNNKSKASSFAANLPILSPDQALLLLPAMLIFHLIIDLGYFFLVMKLPNDVI